MRVLLEGNERDVKFIIRENRIRVERGVIKFTPLADAEIEDTKDVKAEDTKGAPTEDKKEVAETDTKEVKAEDKKKSKK